MKLGLNSDEWFNLYNELVDWQIRFDKHKDIGLDNFLNDQMQSCNKEFVNFYLSNYLDWLNSKTRPLFPNDIVKQVVSPKLDFNKKVMPINC